MAPHTTREVRFEGRRAVCKRATCGAGDPATDARLAFVGRRTDLPVPHVLGVGAIHFVAEWLEGVPIDAPREGAVWARAAGERMARLHDGTAGAFDRTGFPRATGDGSSDEVRPSPSGHAPLALDGQPSWAETVATMLADCRAFPAGRGHDEHAASAAETVAFVREHPEALPEPATPVLCHGNLLPDHLGVTSAGEPTALIDFEHALIGPDAYDYWRTALPPFRARERPGCERAFQEGCSSVGPLPGAVDRDADCYRLVNTVSYLGSLFLQDQHPPDEAERRADWMAAYVRGTVADLRDRSG